MSEPNWQTLKRGEWFYSYCADAVHPHTVAERTDSGWVAVCAMTYANDAAEADARLIVKLKSSAGLVPPPWEDISTHDGSSGEVLGFLAGSMIVMEFCSESGWFDSNGGAYDLHPSHWMPLPSSPLRSPKEETP